LLVGLEIEMKLLINTEMNGALEDHIELLLFQLENHTLQMQVWAVLISMTGARGGATFKELTEVISGHKENLSRGALSNVLKSLISKQSTRLACLHDGNPPEKPLPGCCKSCKDCRSTPASYRYYRAINWGSIAYAFEYALQQADLRGDFADDE
jgi:hypothetical protein